MESDNFYELFTLEIQQRLFYITSTTTINEVQPATSDP